MKIIKQRKGKLTYNGQRLFIEDTALNEINMTPGTKYSTEVDVKSHTVLLKPSSIGNKVSSKIKKGKVVPVIDKVDKGIKEALLNCTSVKITFYKSETGEDRVEIKGTIDTATTLKVNKDNPVSKQLTSITFCAGSGISASCNEKAGFKEIAYCEWNPKEGAEDKFANIFKENHRDSVMFNVPMQELDAADLPYADLWTCTLDCTDYSQLASGKTEYHTMHLFIHVMRLFYQKPKNERPLCIIIENCSSFEKIAGNSMKLALKEEGYHIQMGKLNSLDYGSRTKRERFFFVATAYEGFEMPTPICRHDTPIIEDGIIKLEDLEWITPSDSATLKYFIDRQSTMKHNHKVISYDITKDSYIGTITKSHHKLVPENIIRHPTKPNTYAFLKNTDHLKYLHGIRSDYYLGDSKTIAIQSIGQGVCCNTFYAIVKKVYDFLESKVFKLTEIEKANDYCFLKLDGEQYCFRF